jgi:hypothetical protein
MSTYRVIKDISTTLIKLLVENMSNDLGVSNQDIVLLSPQDAASAKLSVFLYRIETNPHVKNRGMEVRDRNTLGYPPLALDLYYLITPMIEDMEKKHLFLGKVMEIFHDHSVLKGSVLQGDLKENEHSFRLTFCTHSQENMTDLWQSIKDKSFMVSVIYQVSPVFIDSSREMTPGRVEKSQFAYTQKQAKKDEEK